jgi:HK97 family phage major capsid protein
MQTTETGLPAGRARSQWRQYPATDRTVTMKPTEFHRAVTTGGVTPQLLAAARSASLAEQTATELSVRERNAFDVDRLVRALMDRRPMAASFELAVCNEASRGCAYTPYGVSIPFSLLHRDLNVANIPMPSPKELSQAPTTTTGARPLQQLGATFVSGFAADFSIPSFSAAPAPAVVTEVQSISGGTMTTAGIPFTAKRIGVRFTASRQAVLQSPGAVALILRQCEAKIWEKVESQCLIGTGSGAELTGIINVSGVNTVVAGNPDGGTLEFQDLLDMERTATVSTEGASGWILNPSTRAYLRKTLRGTGLGPIYGDDDRALLSHPVACTTLAPADLTKGAGTALSLLAYSQNWNEYFVGIFGNGLDILVDGVTGAAQGVVHFNAALYVDAHPLRPAGFSVMTDAKLS